MTSPLAIVVTTDLSGLSAGMRDAERITQDSGGRMAAALSGVKTGADGATKAMGEFARGQRQQDRVFGWYTSQLAEMAGATTGTRQAMTGLAGAVADFATGSYVGAAIGVAGLLAQAWRDFGVAAKESAVDITKAVDKINTSIDGVIGKLRSARLTLAQQAYTDALNSDEYKGLEAQANKKLDELYAARKRAQEVEDEYNRQQAEYKAGRRLGSDTMASGAVQMEWDRVNAIKSQTKAIIDQKVALESAAAARLKDIEDEQKGAFIGYGQTWAVGSDAASTATRTASAASAGDKEGRAWAEAFRKAVAEFDLGVYQATHGVDLSQSQGAAFEARNREAMKNKNVEATVGQYGVDITPKPTFKSPEVMEAEERAKQAQEESLKRIKEQRAEYQKLGKAAAQALGDIISGNKSAGEAVREFGKQALTVGAKWALASIMNAALKTGAEGASAVAGIPFVGPAMAPGTMASLTAMVSGLAGSIMTAHGGADFAGFPNEFPLIAKKGEMMLPPEDAATMRALRKVHVDGEGRGGPNITIRANDVKSFFDYFESNPREYERRMARAARSAGGRG